MATSIEIDGVTYRVKELCGMSGNLDSAAKSHSVTYEAWREDKQFPSIAALYQAVTALVPATFDGIGAESIGYREDDTGSNRFQFTVNYASKAAEALLRWSFDTSGGTIRVFTSKNTTKYAPTSRTAPDFQGAIGVRNTGNSAEPEGVDVVTPGLRLTASYKWPADSFGIADAKALAAMTGTTNSDTFYTFPPGELLFLGASAGEIASGIPVDVQYQFLASSNATGLSIGSITGIAKKGHEYLWVSFEADSDSTAKKLVHRPLGVYVERVYGESAFADFGIGA